MKTKTGGADYGLDNWPIRDGTQTEGTYPMTYPLSKPRIIKTTYKVINIGAGGGEQII